MGKPRAREPDVAPAALQQEVGRRLAEARLRLGISQTEVAARLRVAATYVSMTERGLRCPRFPMLVAWAVACGVPLSGLVEGLEKHLARSPSK